MILPAPPTPLATDGTTPEPLPLAYLAAGEPHGR